MISVNKNNGLVSELNSGKKVNNKKVFKTILTVVKKLVVVLMIDAWRVVELNWRAWLKCMNINTLNTTISSNTADWINQITWNYQRYFDERFVLLNFILFHFNEINVSIRYLYNLLSSFCSHNFWFLQYHCTYYVL